jgi:glycosyltransferase involved in cell wall biosynthesis
MEQSRYTDPILIILDTTHGQLGGTELNTLNFAKALQKRGLCPLIVEVGAAILAKSTDSKGLSFINIQKDHFEDVGYSQWLRLIKTVKPSVIVRSKTWIGCINWKLDLACLNSTATCLSWEHHPSTANSLKSSVLFEKGKRLLKMKIKLKAWLRNTLHMKSAHRILAVSVAVREALIENFPKTTAKLDVIYPGIDFDFFSRSSEARKRLRANWNIPESAFVLGSLGRLVPHKRNDFTLKVFAELVKFHPDIWCVIAGRGPDLQNLQVISETLGIENRVVFPGWQEHAPDTWSAIDLFLMPSIDEGLGMTLIESVACGCLVLGTETRGMDEILDGPLIETRVAANDLDSWVTKASKIIQSSERLSLHLDALNYLRGKFDAQRQFDLMVDWVKNYSSFDKPTPEFSSSSTESSHDNHQNQK